MARTYAQAFKDISDLLEDFDPDRVKMGRLSTEDERVMEQLARSNGALLWRAFGAGRYHTDLRQIGLRTSRPRTGDGRETTVFRHSTVAKRRAREVPPDRIYLKVSGRGSMSGIEVSAGVRKDLQVSVGGKSGGWYVRRARDIPAGMEVAPASEVTPRVAGARGDAAARRQRYIEREGAVEESPVSDGSAGEGEAAGSRSSVGNIAVDKKGRTAFWRAVQARERGNGRIQSAIVAELPFEPAVGADGRRRIVASFGERLGARGLRWHGVVHRPEDHGDARNFHMHLVYHDRPAECVDGVWVFAERKLPETREFGFVRRLREEFCEAVNEVLERSGVERRLDPRTYEKMGISKRPGVHLGGAAHALERAGVVTTLGTRNVAAELDYAILRLLGRERRLLEDDVAAIGAALEAASDLEGVQVPVLAAARRAVAGAAADFAEAAMQRARSEVREKWCRERRDLMARRPIDVAERGRDPAGRRDAARIVDGIATWWEPSLEDAALHRRRSASLWRRARHRLDSAAAAATAEALLLRRVRVLGEIGEVESPLRRDGEAWAAETLRTEARLRAAEAFRAEEAARVRAACGALGVAVDAGMLEPRTGRRQLRALLEERGADLSETAPPGPGADAGRGLRRLDEMGVRIARLRGTLRLRKRAASLPAGAGGGSEEREMLAGGLRRRLDAIDREILATPTALALARRRGMEERLLAEGELARRRRKAVDRSRES